MTNSHDDLHKIVTQKEKDRTVTGVVTAQQVVAADLNSRVTQLEKDRTVTNAIAANLKAEVSGTVDIGEATVIQPDPALLKSTVTQAAIARTVTNAVAANLKIMVYPDPLSPLWVIQLNENLLKASVYQGDYSALKGQMKVTDGTNFMPTMDAVARPGFQKITDGVKTVGGVYDNITGKFSIATSRGAGKNTFTEEFAGEHVELEIIAPALGKRIMVVGVVTSAGGDIGKINLDMAGMLIWRHYVAKFKTVTGMDMSIIGEANIPVVLNTPGVGETDEFFVLINYREID